MLNALVSPGKINGLFTNGRAAFPFERVCASIPGQLTPSRGGVAPTHPGSLLWLIRNNRAKCNWRIISTKAMGPKPGSPGEITECKFLEIPQLQSLCLV